MLSVPAIQPRVASIKNIGAISALISNCAQNLEHQGIYQWDSIYPNDELIAQDITKQALYFLAQAEQIIAIMTIDSDQPLEYSSVTWAYSDSPIMVIHRMAVHPNFQGKGIGKGLVRHAEDIARLAKYRAIRLDAFIPNLRAVKLYTALGFRNAGKVTFRKGDFYCFEKRLEQE